MNFNIKNNEVIPLCNEYENLYRSILNPLVNIPKWENQPFENVKHTSNTKFGASGEILTEELCKKIPFHYEFPLNEEGKRKTRHSWDMKIEDYNFEIKTASQDINNSFQFNCIKVTETYDAVICLGIMPNNILFKPYSFNEIKTGKAGKLSSMDKGSKTSYKLTKTISDLISLNLFPSTMKEFFKMLRN